MEGGTLDINYNLVEGLANGPAGIRDREHVEEIAADCETLFFHVEWLAASPVRTSAIARVLCARCGHGSEGHKKKMCAC